MIGGTYMSSHRSIHSVCKWVRIRIFFFGNHIPGVVNVTIPLIGQRMHLKIVFISLFNVATSQETDNIKFEKLLVSAHAQWLKPSIK
jgi:hypothetical protein